MSMDLVQESKQEVTKVISLVTVAEKKQQLTLVISTSLISNNRLSRSENLAPA